MDAIIEEIVKYIPLPIIFGAGIIILGGWLIKVLRRDEYIGDTLRRKSFISLFIITVVSLLLCFGFGGFEVKGENPEEEVKKETPSGETLKEETAPIEEEKEEIAPVEEEKKEITPPLEPIKNDTPSVDTIKPPPPPKKIDTCIHKLPDGDLEKWKGLDTIVIYTNKKDDPIVEKIKEYGFCDSLNLKVEIIDPISNESKKEVLYNSMADKNKYEKGLKKIIGENSNFEHRTSNGIVDINHIAIFINK